MSKISNSDDFRFEFEEPKQDVGLALKALMDGGYAPRMLKKLALKNRLNELQGTDPLSKEIQTIESIFSQLEIMSLLGSDAGDEVTDLDLIHEQNFIETIKSIFDKLPIEIVVDWSETAKKYAMLNNFGSIDVCGVPYYFKSVSSK